MMEFRTPVDLPKNMPMFSLDSHVLLVGSCFVEHIGRCMADCLPEGHVVVNPMGVLYNPESIRQILCGLLSDNMPWANQSFEGRDGLWHNWMCSTLFSASTRAELEQTMRKQWKKATHILHQKQPQIITTWSTDMVYRFDGEVVANCHKESSTRFSQEELTYEEIVPSWEAMCQSLKAMDASLLFTLSPYRYLKQGLTAGGASKARLRHAIDTLCRRNSQQCHYFPAYEIMMDELRDYRFYDRDMLHPSEVAVDYIWERFTERAFTPELKCFAKEKQNIMRDLHHRPLHPESEATKQFVRRCEERKADFIRRWGMW